MAKRILMDTICLSLEVPQGLDKSVYLKVRRALRSKRFRTRFREALDNVFDRFSALRPVRLTIE
jgi:hypothetical protein